jgi:hypothetical protein
MSWYRVPLWDLRPDITFCRNVAVWNLWSSFCGAPSLTRGRVCNLLVQLLLDLARAVTLRSKSLRIDDHILLSHLRLPQPGGSGSRIYIPQEHGVPVIPLRTELTKMKVEVTLQLTVSQSTCRSWSYFATDSQSVSQVLVSSTLAGLATRYYFLSECCCLKFAVLYLLGALSDERTSLQFAV